MFKEQRTLTENVLFNYYMVSSTRENEVYSPFTFYLNPGVLESMIHSALVLDKLVHRMITKVLEGKDHSFLPVGEFPLCREILQLECPVPPFFWVRYDTFQRADGGIFFSEFNYDKPCAQREIAVSDMLQPHHNPNTDFILKFRKSFEQHWTRQGYPDQKPRVAILVDPGHYEEAHLAQLYMDFLKPLDYEVHLVGSRNLYVEEETVKAFGHKIDIILRQYPTEFLYEMEDIQEILRLYNQGKVLILNDPRAMIGQAKSLFASLWELVERYDPFLSAAEVEVIRKTIPYTKIFQVQDMDELIQHKDRYVIKAVFGRYSEEVYIGRMLTQDEWMETIRYVAESGKDHIIQEFCPIQREQVLKFNGIAFEETGAYGNFGIYLIDGEFAGTCARWSTDYLSSEDVVWITPVGIADKPLKTAKLFTEKRELLWNTINEETAFQWGYTGGYTGKWESFSLQALLLEKAAFLELEEATRQLTAIFKKTTELVQAHIEIFSPVLGINDHLSRLVVKDDTGSMVLTGRFDWVMDNRGRWKLLEFNSETPAGLMESIYLNDKIIEKTGAKWNNPNQLLGKRIRDSFFNIVRDYEGVQAIKNIGIVTSSYYEDWYNTLALFEQVKSLPYKFILGEVSGLAVKEDKLYLYGTPLDAVYRYYPLDWFDQDPYYEGVIEALASKTMSINPPATFISQSKAFLALLWELLDQGYFNSQEKEMIERYIPKTALTPRKLKTMDYCIKPFWGREGQCVSFSYEKSSHEPPITDSIFQERVDIQGIQLELYHATGMTRETVFPVIGTYIMGNEFGGIYTRAGGRVTNRWAVYLPTFIKD